MLHFLTLIGWSMAEPTSTFPINTTNPLSDSDSLVTTTSVFPALSGSLQDDATTLWTNPSNFAFAPAITKGLAITQRDDNTGFAFAKQVGIIGYGLHYNQHEQLGSWWSASSALALKLDKHLSISTTSTWHSIESPDDSFVKWDVGMSWRPLQWLGLAGSINNLGSSQDSWTPERMLLGGGLSLIDNRLQLGVDYITNTQNLETLGAVQSTIRIRPIKGLGIQFQSQNLDEYGVGIQLGYGLGELGTFANISNSNSLSVTHLSGVNDKSIVSKGRRVASFTLDGALPYQSESGLFQSGGETYMSFLRRLKKASTDPSVKGIFLQIEQMGVSTAQIEEIRSILLDSRNRGKKVIVYANGSVGNGEYYLASAASSLLAHPAGSIELIGLHSERMYFNELMMEVGIEPEFVKREKYKSAPEQYTHREGSEASKEQTNALLDAVFEHMTTEIANNRGIPLETLTTLIDQAPFANTQAKGKGMIDELLYEDEIEDFLDQEFGILHWMEDNYGWSRPDGWESNPEVAIIPIAGVIMPGPSQSPGLLGGGSSAGAKTIVGQINEAADDDAVKAIVLRVDSPGGSAFASDQIWRAVTQAKIEKPIIVSMGGVAASGGYYVAAAADAIFAEETTITGSIGVYSGKFNAHSLLQYLKINVESEDRGAHASLYSMFDGWNDSQRAKMEEQVELTYQQFKTIVSEGRNMDMDTVENVARGRVWAGVDAKDVGLVDQNGGLYDAIDFACKEAGIKEASVQLIQYASADSGSSFYKTGVEIQNTLQQIQHPLQQEQLFLQTVTSEHTWMLSPVWSLQ